MASAHPQVHSRDVESTLPSERCEHREEWQPTCLMWSGQPRNRYIVAGKLKARDGVGAQLRRIGTVIDLALSFDLEVVYHGPFLAAHGAGEWGTWFGLVGAGTNPLLATTNPNGYQLATREKLLRNNSIEGIAQHENRTSVVFVPFMMNIGVFDWGAPATPTPARYDGRICTYTRHVLRQVYWGREKDRDRCHSFLRDTSFGLFGTRKGLYERKNARTKPGLPL